MKVRVPRSGDFSLRPTSARADPLRAFKPLNYDNPYLGLRGNVVDRVEHGFLTSDWLVIAGAFVGTNPTDERQLPACS
jgi:hypothetical protein